MSGNTRSSAPDAARLALLALFAVSLATATALQAPALPQLAHDAAPGLKVQGGGEMTFFGLSIYNGYYWSVQRGYSLDHPFALDLQYQRRFDGRKIAERSVDEIEKLGFGTAAERKHWGDEMARIFPNVAKGDRLTGLFVPPGLVRYFHNGKPIGEIADPGFARAFFGIWFDPRTSRAEFRKKLLGETP